MGTRSISNSVRSLLQNLSKYNSDLDKEVLVGGWRKGLNERVRKKGKMRLYN
jgi:hypothetical protein